MDDHFYYKTGQVLLQNAAAFLLQNGARFITKRGRYYKTGQGLLQNAAGITKRAKGYYETRQVYKMRQLLQNGAVQGQFKKARVLVSTSHFPPVKY